MLADAARDNDVRRYLRGRPEALALIERAQRGERPGRRPGEGRLPSAPRDEHERHAGRAASGRGGPPGQELPGAGTGGLNQIAVSATPSQAGHLPRSRAGRALPAIRIRPSASRDSSEWALGANCWPASGEPCRQQERPDGRPNRPGGLIPQPHELLPRNKTPDTIAGWKAAAEALLIAPCCAFHRNVQISSRYAWMYTLQPACFKWAAMAAIASHHVRLALFPLRLDTDRTGYVDIPHSLQRRKLLLTEDVNTIRAANNAIFNDIFWVHLAYVTADDGIERLRALLRAERHYAPVLAGFEAIDQGRSVLEDQMTSAEARQKADDLIWEGNVDLLEHEQRTLVQPSFDRLSRASAWLVSTGSATSFEARGVRQEITHFTSFYLYSFTQGIPHALRARAWPTITRFDDRWRWLVTSVVPRFRRFDADTRLVDASLRHIFDEARDFASAPCVQPRPPADRPSPAGC
jgi:hypothetical protein